MEPSNDSQTQLYRRTIFKLFTGLFVLALIVAAETLFLCYHTLLAGPGRITETNIPEKEKKTIPAIWTPPPESDLPAGAEGEAIRYGRELIAHTAQYLGPRTPKPPGPLWTSSPARRDRLFTGISGSPGREA